MPPVRYTLNRVRETVDDKDALVAFSVFVSDGGPNDEGHVEEAGHRTVVTMSKAWWEATQSSGSPD